MSIDVRNQIQVRSHNLIKFGEKPQNSENSEQSVDEEKSNAAKWMIGLTATAAIVVGGLWAAREGHLGESAQKSVKKLLGEATDAVSNSKKKETPSDSKKNTDGVGGSKDEPDTRKPDDADIDGHKDEPDLGNGGKDELDVNNGGQDKPDPKNPDVNGGQKDPEPEPLTSKDELEVSNEQKDPEPLASKDEPEVSPNKSDEAENPLAKDEPEPQISNEEHQQPVKVEDKKTVSEPTAEVPTNTQTKKFKIGADEAEHTIETNENGEVIREIIGLRTDLNSLSYRLERQGDYFVPTKGSFWDIDDYLKNKFNDLPDKFKYIRVFNDFRKTYRTPRAHNNYHTDIDKLPKEISTVEFVECEFSHDSENFARSVNEIELIRKFLEKFKNTKYGNCTCPSPYGIMLYNRDGKVIKVNDYLADKPEKFIQLFKENFGDIETITHDAYFSSSALITDILNKLL